MLTISPEPSFNKLNATRGPEASLDDSGVVPHRRHRHGQIPSVRTDPAVFGAMTCREEAPISGVPAGSGRKELERASTETGEQLHGFILPAGLGLPRSPLGKKTRHPDPVIPARLGGATERWSRSSLSKCSSRPPLSPLDTLGRRAEDSVTGRPNEDGTPDVVVVPGSIGPKCWTMSHDLTRVTPSGAPDVPVGSFISGPLLVGVDLQPSGSRRGRPSPRRRARTLRRFPSPRRGPQRRRPGRRPPPRASCLRGLGWKGGPGRPAQGHRHRLRVPIRLGRCHRVRWCTPVARGCVGPWSHLAATLCPRAL